MKLIRKLGTRLNKNGTHISYGEFLCPNPVCNKIVERQLSNGKRDKSCGCGENNRAYKHGGSYTRLYNSWADMKQRVLNSNDNAYKDWGGRGITICNEWLEFIPFRDWALSNGYTDNLVIDRKNPDGNYEPNNCRWITKLESNRNKTNTITLEIANEIRELYKTDNYIYQQLSILFNVKFQTIGKIINNKIWKEGR